MQSDHHAAETSTWAAASLEVGGPPAKAAKTALKASDTVHDLGLATHSTVVRQAGAPVALAATWEPSGTPSGWDVFKDAIQGARFIAGVTGLPETGLTVAVTTFEPDADHSRR